MAIDRRGIDSLDLDAGATKSPSGSSIKYEGDIVEPQMKMAAWEGSPGMDSREEVRRAWKDFLDAKRNGTFKGTWEQFMPLWIKGNLASAQGGMEPMSAAQGGIAGYRGGQLVKPGPGRPGYQGWEGPSWSGGSSGSVNVSNEPDRGSDYGQFARAVSQAANNPPAPQEVNVSNERDVRYTGPNMADVSGPISQVTDEDEYLPPDIAHETQTQEEINKKIEDLKTRTIPADEGLTTDVIHQSGYDTSLTPQQQNEINKTLQEYRGDPVGTKYDLSDQAAAIPTYIPPTGGDGEGTGDTGTNAPVSTGGITAVTGLEPTLSPEEEEEWKKSVQFASLPTGLKYGPQPGDPRQWIPESSRLQYAQDISPVLAAHGGRVPAAFGGIMDSATGRKGYFLGSVGDIFGGIADIPKKAIKAVKKVAKSPLGKIALGYLATAGMANIGAGGTWGSPWGKGSGWLHPSKVMGNIGESWTGLKSGASNILGLSETAEQTKLASAFKTAVDEGRWKDAETIKNLIKGGGTLTGTRTMGPLAKASLIGLPFLSMTKWGQELGKPVYDPNTQTKEEYDQEVAEWSAKHLAGLDEETWKLPGTLPNTLQYAARGGRIGAQEGGLMDLGGMEKDYRQEGGFVPIGGQERADDVPARLSKNEFVFTADAVRAAGGGDIDAGAEVMENVMENLEQGGQVSEESQGLEGARNMFATAQRLEGVM